MANSQLPTIEILHKLLVCDAETGTLIWKPRPLSFFRDGKQSAKHNQCAWNAKFSQVPAFNTIANSGYFVGSLFKKKYLAHRVIWAMRTGAWPAEQIDHINHIRTDNRIVNLREATQTDNSRNQSLSKNNTSGVTGVSWCARDRLWTATIGHEGDAVQLGHYKNKNDAVFAREAAERKYGYHRNHGK